MLLAFVSFHKGDGNLFQCSDLILIEGAQVPANETCANDDSLASNATVTATPTAITTAVTGTAAAATQNSITGAAASSAVASSNPSNGAEKSKQPLILGSLLAALIGFTL